ncbi:MAG: hypothetical protein PHF63_06125 [Herbinix sp.]|nr:hypothetical protein [Herbinix sp.]
MNYITYANRILTKFLPNKTWKKHLYKIKCKELSESELGNLLKTNQRLKDIHKGQRCFVLGNGPSLSKIDLSLLKDEITFTVNDLYYNENFDKINTTYHLFADPLYFTELEGTIMKLTNKFSPKGIFIESSGYQKMVQNDLNSKYSIYVYANGIEVDDLKFMQMDLCKLLPYYCTVVQSAITIASYMGFREIYLLGCDCTGILNYIDRVQGQKIKNYAFDLPEEEQQKLKVIKVTSENIFFEWYHIFKSYRILREILKGKNIKLINLTENSILDSLEKGNLKDVITTKQGK